MKATLTTARQAFEEQIAAFALRLELVGTERYDDLRAQEHYRAFAVAGAMKADLLADLREAVRVAIVDGGTIQQFRKDFQQIVERHGWHGWTGEGTRLGEAWRTRVIYQTNARKSYSAGRYAQLTDPTVTAVLPYWRWRHSGLARDPRPEHQAWNGMTLHHTHPFWKTHFPPRVPPDWGCGCRVEAVRAPAEGAVTSPPDGWDGESEGLGVAPPEDVVADIRAMIREKQSRLPPALARDLGEVIDSYQIGSRGPLRTVDAGVPVTTPVTMSEPAALSAPDVVERLASAEFAAFFAAAPGAPARFPVAELDSETQRLFGSSSSTVWLSRTSLDEHIERHPEVGIDDYRQIPRILAEGEVWATPPNRYLLLYVGDRAYRAAIKTDRDGREMWFLSLVVSPKQKPPKGAVRLR